MGSNRRNGIQWGLTCAAITLFAAMGCGSSATCTLAGAAGKGGGPAGAAGKSGQGGGGQGGGGQGGGTSGAGGHAGGATSDGGSPGGATGNGGHAGGAAGNGGSTGGGGAIAAGGQGSPCALTTSYVITGGVVAKNAQQATLSPPATFQAELDRFPSQLAISSCAPPLPACHTDSAIDVSDLTAALQNADVQAAFEQSLMTTYEQAGDAPIQIQRASDDHTIRETTPCIAPGCKPAPDGVRLFIALTKDLLKQQLADASCANVRQP